MGPISNGFVACSVYKSAAFLRSICISMFFCTFFFSTSTVFGIQYSPS
jgi:hypothetical protein